MVHNTFVSNISPEAYPMVGGDGPHSYAKNSIYQVSVAASQFGVNL